MEERGKGRGIGKEREETRRKEGRDKQVERAKREGGRKGEGRNGT
jgi:hypothetical protein